MSLRTKLLLGAGVGAAVAVTVMMVAGARLNRRFEPYIQEQARLYLSRRFESEVEIGSLQVRLPKLPPISLFLSKGRGVIAEVVGTKIVLRHKGRRDIPPMFAIERLRFEVDLGRVFEPKKRVAMVHLHGMKIVIPPKGDRPSLRQPVSAPVEPSFLPMPAMPAAQDFLIEQAIIADSELIILPRDRTRQPLEFKLHRVALSSLQTTTAMKYEAELTNPKPPGLIKSNGEFGPWNADSPSDSPLSGKYAFKNADLGVFRVIAGILQSTGSFEGVLGKIAANGEARVPDFRLRMAGHPLPLYARFETIVDGTNGNTTLKPVHARLRNTEFTTSGAVIKHDGDTRRSIDLKMMMTAGDLIDLLALAMKAPPPMSGRIRMDATIRVPPLAGRVVEKLILDGLFSIERGQFLTGAQDKVDELSRRAQGQPKNDDIDNVFSVMTGKFHMADQSLTFQTVTFRVPGAAVELSGNYDLDEDDIDFSGSLKLDAKVSQTQSGWKRWALKPVDPFLARKGAGTFLRIKVGGSSKAPKFSASR